MNRDDLLELIPAYVLAALEDDERIMVEAFIKKDSEAQQLVQEYEAVTSVLALTTPIKTAPAHLKSDLQQRLAMRQNQAAPSTEKIETAPRLLRLSYNILISSAAAIIVVIFGLIFFVNRVSAPDLAQGQVLYNEIVAQAGFQSFEVTPAESENTSGELVVSEDGRQAVLRVAALPTIPETQRYQLWLVQEDSVESGGLFYWSTGDGPYYIIMPLDRPIDEYVGFGMSLEPENGSPFPDAPSGSQLFGVSLAQAD
jgi:anti-sigma-K factor RskA